MKIENILFSILLISVVFGSCSSNEEDSILFVQQLAINSSSGSIVLEESKAEETALVFSWNEGADRGEGTSLSYLFKMDVAGRNFETTIEPEQMNEGVFSRSFTHEELNNLITDYWSLKPDAQLTIEARVIAKVDGPRFIKPEVSTIQVNVMPYKLKVYEVEELYAIGSALQSGGSPVKMTQTVEDLNSFVYKGTLGTGDIMFMLSATGEGDVITAPEPGIAIEDGSPIDFSFSNKGIGSANRWVVDEAGEYTIVVNARTKKVTFRSPKTAIVPLHEGIWLIGEGLPGTENDWNITNPVRLKRSIANPNIFTYEGELEWTPGTNTQRGGVKFLLGYGSFDVDWLSPISRFSPGEVGVAVIRGKPMDVYHNKKSPESSDTYWLVTEPNTNVIVLDMENMLVTFLSR